MLKRSAIAFITMLLLLAPATFAPAREGKGRPERLIAGAWVKVNPRGGVDTLDFHPDGRFELILENGAVKEVFGHYTATRRKIVINADGGRNHCMKTGIYTFDFAGRELRISRHDDPCPGRDRILIGVWKRR
ncbi:MAG: hypothetical protein HZB29_04075 [Nitrospinae bacterium]|nr:hypothetical protein [Nitrospinota bacterium]